MQTLVLIAPPPRSNRFPTCTSGFGARQGAEIEDGRAARTHLAGRGYADRTREHGNRGHHSGTCGREKERRL